MDDSLGTTEKIALDELPLLDLQGNPASLTNYFQQYVLLIFLRHLAWLPCQAHLGEVNAAKAEFERRGVAIVVVSFAESAKLIHYQEHRRWPFTILADPERRAYRAFNLKRLSWFELFSPATLIRYLKLFREGMEREDYGHEDIHQSGGDFLLDREGKVLFAHRSRNPADRPSAAELVSEVDRLRSA
jgi:peroxiredoxin